MDLRDFYLLAALIACLRLDSAIAQELIYTIREELPENVPIGNIPKDLNISHINAATGTSASLVYRLVSKAGDAPLVKVSSRPCPEMCSSWASTPMESLRYFDWE